MDISKYCTDRIVDSPFVTEKKMWPALPALITAIASLASSVLGASSNHSTNKANQAINDAQIKASEDRLREEQNYNNFLLQNQKQMQMTDAKQAGINPAFAGPNLVSGMSSSPSVPVPSMIPMQSYDWSSLGNLGPQISNALLQGAQIDKTKAEEGLIKAQEVNQIIANKYADRLYKGQADFVESNVQVNGENIKFTRKQCEKISSEIMQINKAMEQSDAQIALLKQQTALFSEEQKLKFQEALFAEQSFNDRLEQIRKQNKLTDEEINRIKKMTVAEIANLNSATAKNNAEKGLIGQQTETEKQQTKLTEAQVTNTKQSTSESKARTVLTKQQTKTEAQRTKEVYWNANSNKLHFKLDEKYQDAERTIAIAKATAETIESCANASNKIVETINPVEQLNPLPKSIQ